MVQASNLLMSCYVIFFLLILVSIHCWARISELTEQNRKLAQELALMKMLESNLYKRKCQEEQK